MKKLTLLLKEINLLIVEDDILLRTVCVDMIKPYLNTIYEASNGKEALLSYQQHRQDIVITDLRMPLMGGLELSTKLREINPTLPIIVLSAYTQSDTLIKLIPLGLINFILKPAQIPLLMESLTTAVKFLNEKSVINFPLSKECFYSFPKKSLIQGDKEIKLTAKEVLLLELLIKQESHIVSFGLIEDVVYHQSSATPNTISTLIYNLRKKIGKNNIHSINSLGYQLVVER